MKTTEKIWAISAIIFGSVGLTGCYGDEGEDGIFAEDELVSTPHYGSSGSGGLDCSSPGNANQLGVNRLEVIDNTTFAVIGVCNLPKDYAAWRADGDTEALANAHCPGLVGPNRSYVGHYEVGQTPHTCSGGAVSQNGASSASFASAGLIADNGSQTSMINLGQPGNSGLFVFFQNGGSNCPGNWYTAYLNSRQKIGSQWTNKYWGTSNGSGISAARINNAGMIEQTTFTSPYSCY